jgi:hypothetical protein
VEELKESVTETEQWEAERVMEARIRDMDDDVVGVVDLAMLVGCVLAGAIVGALAPVAVGMGSSPRRRSAAVNTFAAPAEVARVWACGSNGDGNMPL